MKPSLAVIGIVIASACLIGYYGIHVPAQNEVRLIQAQITEEQASQGLKSDVSALLARIGRYREQLPADADPSWLAEQVVTLAQRAGVQPASITQESPHTSPEYTRLSVNLQLSATYHQLGAFLDEIERSSFFITIDRLSVERMEDTEQGLVHVTFSTIVVPRLTQGGGA
jgi:Tfp pilus assembly protein PilO